MFITITGLDKSMVRINPNFIILYMPNMDPKSNRIFKTYFLMRGSQTEFYAEETAEEIDAMITAAHA